MTATALIARLAAVAAGVWLMFAPAVFDYAGRAADNDRIFGPIAASFAFVAIWQLLRPLRWVSAPIGVWLIVSPLVLGYGLGAAFASSVAAGAVIAAAAPFGRADTDAYGGGWATVFPGRGRWQRGRRGDGPGATHDAQP